MVNDARSAAYEWRRAAASGSVGRFGELDAHLLERDYEFHLIDVVGRVRIDAHEDVPDLGLERGANLDAALYKYDVIDLAGELLREPFPSCPPTVVPCARA